MYIISKEIKLKYCELFINGLSSATEIAKDYEVPRQNIYEWVKKYKAFGESAFDTKNQKHYSKELKISAVKEALKGNSSLF